jgi:hypothetical protein
MPEASVVKQRIGAWLDAAMTGLTAYPEEHPYDFYVEGVPGPDMFARVLQLEGNATLLVIEFPLLKEFEITPQLFQHIGQHSGDLLIGHLFLTGEPPRHFLSYQHAVLSNSVDASDLLNLVRLMAGTANELRETTQISVGGLFMNMP